MSTVSVPTPHARRPERSLPTWIQSEALWAGLAIITMWLAVLFVGIFGADIVDGMNASGGTLGDTIPSVVVVAGFAFLATPFVARWGFMARRPEIDELRATLADERLAREKLAAEVAELQTHIN